MTINDLVKKEARETQLFQAKWQAVIKMNLSNGMIDQLAINEAIRELSEELVNKMLNMGLKWLK